MKTRKFQPKLRTARAGASRRDAGNAMLVVVVLTGLMLIAVGAALTRSQTTVKLNERYSQYRRSVAAAEAATEKILTQVSKDYLAKGEPEVVRRLDTYRRLLPTSGESATWNNWEFRDSAGRTGQASVELGRSGAFVEVNSIYKGLRGFVTKLSIVAHARQLDSSQTLAGGVQQEVDLARIPIFQFAMFSSLDMEISCGQPFRVTGRVHSNKQLYVEPDSDLTFEQDATAAGTIVFSRSPLDSRSSPAGTVTYLGRHDSKVASLHLPIGRDNTPEAVADIIQPPPPGEDPDSDTGRSRFYNQTDILVVVTNGSAVVTSGRFNNFGVSVPTNEVALFVKTNASFWDAREEKTVRPIDIDVGNLRSWAATNSNVRNALGVRDVSSVYVVDLRPMPATQLGAVRLINGTELPSLGLTVATGRPLYIQGHYNQPNAAHLATANTSATKPAAVAADALTILSPAWTDAKSSLAVGSRVASASTVNAGVLAGQVLTSNGKYSGGMENFPRFLETWGAGTPLTYNGSLVAMFISRYATNVWGKANVYAPPKRNWAFDLNFTNALTLPPLTPGLTTVLRGRWTTVALQSEKRDIK